MENEEIFLTLTVAEVNVVLAALSELPYKSVGVVIQKIKTQGDDQIAAISGNMAEPTEEQSESNFAA